MSAVLKLDMPAREVHVQRVAKFGGEWTFDWQAMESIYCAGMCTCVCLLCLVTDVFDEAGVEQRLHRFPCLAYGGFLGQLGVLGIALLAPTSRIALSYNPTHTRQPQRTRQSMSRLTGLCLMYGEVWTARLVV